MEQRCTRISPFATTECGGLLVHDSLEQQDSGQIINCVRCVNCGAYYFKPVKEKEPQEQKLIAQDLNVERGVIHRDERRAFKKLVNYFTQANIDDARCIIRDIREPGLDNSAILRLHYGE